MAQKRISDLPEADALTGDELLEASQLSSTVSISANTISAAATDNSFNDSANGFVAAGFAVGDRVHVSGFTGNAANNIYVGILTTVAAGKLTIGGTDGDVIVDDAAGEVVTISKWTSARTTAQDIADLGGGGSGVPVGGTTGQVLGKLSDADGDADWIDQTGGGGGGTGSNGGEVNPGLELDPVPTLLNSYVSFGSGYGDLLVVKMGRTVTVSGLLSGGAGGSAAFNLPAGWRPSQNQQFAVPTSGGATVLDLLSNGDVKPGPYTTYVGVTFSFDVPEEDAYSPFISGDGVKLNRSALCRPPLASQFTDCRTSARGGSTSNPPTLIDTEGGLVVTGDAAMENPAVKSMMRPVPGAFSGTGVDFEFTAHIGQFDGNVSDAQGGICVESSTGDTLFFGFFRRSSTATTMQKATEVSSSWSDGTFDGMRATPWVRILCTGTRVRTYYSDDGFAWNLFTDEANPLGGDVAYYGFYLGGYAVDPTHHYGVAYFESNEFPKIDLAGAVITARPWYWKPPRAADFAGDTWGAQTLQDDDDVGLIYYSQNTNVCNIDGFALPAADWTATWHLEGNLRAQNYANVGMGFCNTAHNKFFLWSKDSRSSLHFFRYNATAFDGYEVLIGMANDAPNWFRVRYDAATGNAHMDYSYNGKLWITDAVVHDVKTDFGGAHPDFFGPVTNAEPSVAYVVAGTLDHFTFET